MKAIWPVLRDLFPLLPAGARRFFIGFVVLSSALTLLDVAAMGLLALTISPAVTQAPIEIPILGEFPAEDAPWLILTACLLLIVKSALNVLIQFIATRRFALYEFAIGKRLFSAYIRSSWEDRTRRTTAEITRIADLGTARTMNGFVVPVSRMPAAIATFVLLLGVLMVTQPLTALIALVYLVIVALVVNRLVTRRALQAGDVERDYTYRVAILMTEVVEALKELTLRNRLGELADVISANRQRSVRARANVSFLGILPQYSFEAALIGGFLLIGGATILIAGPSAAVSAVALFAATGFRLIPAVVSLQNSVVAAISTLPWARDVVNDLRDAEATVVEKEDGVDGAALSEHPRTLELKDVSFAYRNSSKPVLDHLDLQIPMGSTLGIVGPSGAGKSTLIDLLLGLSQPTAGTIAIDGLPLREVIHAWRGRVGYVPQRVALFDGSIAQNIALSWGDDFDRDKVDEVLAKVRLTSLVEDRVGGIDAKIGERGLSLSGGQQQRLGIARALYSDPLVLVLDEATSSLDVETENAITRELMALTGDMTVISVAHRLSTIKDFDRICYLDSGRIVSSGTFSELAGAVPAFGAQVRLAGLEGFIGA